MVDVSEADVLEILEKESEFIGVYKNHEIIPLSETPVGFLADHYILRVHFTASFKDYFLKAVPRHVEKRVEYLDETGFFAKEMKVYESLMPKLLESSSLSWAPKCFLTRDGHFIVMEILSDFKTMSTPQLVLDFDHLKVAASSLAIFHASSLIFEEKSGEGIAKNYTKMLEENAYPLTVGHIRRKGLENAIEVLSELIRLIPKFNESQKITKTIDKFQGVIRKIYKFAEPSRVYKNVFSHGDLWVNNFMFKYEDGKPISCKIIDFQLARHSPPAFDLAQLVYTNSTKELREVHLDDVLNIYCDTFEMELIKGNVDPTTCPRTEILESFREYHLAGLIEAAVFGHLTLLPSTLSSSILSSSEEYDNFINQSRVKTCLKAFELNYYRDRITEILTEIIDQFVITSE